MAEAVARQLSFRDITMHLVQQMMSFSADLLVYKTPPTPPHIVIDPTLTVLGNYSWRPPTIRLRSYNQGTLVHELTHYIQDHNGVPMSGNTFGEYDPLEIEAITAQIRWLQRIGVDKYPSQAAILKMTGCSEFASLGWL